MTHVKLAIAPQWFEDQEMITAFFMGLLYRATERRDFDIEFVRTNDYGSSLAVIETNPDADFLECELAARIMSLSMEWRKKSDPFAELRRMSAEDRKDRAEVAKIIDAYFESAAQE